MNTEMEKGKLRTKEETKNLLKASSKVINNKSNNATTNRLKTQEWVWLTPQQLHLKWEILKKNARKRRSEIRLNKNQTGGGPDYIQPYDILDRVAGMLDSTDTDYTVPIEGDREPEALFVIGDGAKLKRIDAKDAATDDPSRTARNFAIASYYETKKKFVDAKLTNIVIENENLKIQNEILKMQLAKLKKP